MRTASDATLLALVLWREARGESVEAREAVAGVILERARHPGWWGKSIYGVCTAPRQFSSLTDPGDHQLSVWPPEDDKEWIECQRIAEDACAGILDAPLPGSDHYHDVSIPPPSWAKASRATGQIGRLKFYRLGRFEGDV